MIPNDRKEIHFMFLLPYFTQNQVAFILLIPGELPGTRIFLPKIHKNAQKQKFFM